MNKLWLIIKREYLSRVKKRTFILTTILAPIGFVIFWIAMIFIMSSGTESKRMAVLDESGLLQLDGKKTLADSKLINFTNHYISLDSLKSFYEEWGF